MAVAVLFQTSWSDVTTRTPAEAQVERWRDARWLVIAFLEGDSESAAAIVSKRVDGQHRDEVKLFVGELARVAAELGECWQAEERPGAPVAGLIRGMLLGEAFKSLLAAVAAAGGAESR